ncbi:MAG: OmpA family protein [Crocinitomicaceae bacterium]|nr:OmpA family protein [Crocinitomicaceae bacterium]
MPKFLLVFFSLVFLNFSFYSQFRYSTKSKKAIKLLEAAQKAPGQTLDPKTRQPNYREGILLLEQSLKKDPNFWEAHILSAQFNENLNNYKQAIFHYESALQINPEHSRYGSTHYYLSALYLAEAEYEKALKYADVFMKNPNASEEFLRNAKEIKQHASFAINALKNPKNFNPINAGNGINTADPEYYPTITVDGKTLLFTRSIADNRVKGYQEQEDFFVSNWDKINNWQKAIPMASNVNTINNEGAPTISADGKSLIFVACSDETGTYYGENRYGKGSCDLFYTKKIGGKWINPINLPGGVNSSHWESQPSLSADGQTLYFVRGLRGKNTNGNSDIYVSHLQSDGNWGSALRLSDVINTAFAEESVCIHPDGKTLYFASRGHIGMGGSDLFISKMDANGNWGKPVNLGYPINTKFDENSLLVSPIGDVAFFASDRTGGFGDLDIYYFELPLEYRPTKTLYFDGNVFDQVSKSALPGHFQLTDIESGEIVIISDADKIDGSFMVALPVNKEYAIQVTHAGYAPYSINFNLKIPDGSDHYHIDIPMNPLTSSTENVLANIFFDLGKSTLRKESAIELKTLASFLSRNPTIKIELGGHTDSRGNEADNLLLSTERAKAVYDYLIANERISKERLSFKGYGKTQPIFSDKIIETMKTSEEKEIAHQKNRRTVYKIIK